MIVFVIRRYPGSESIRFKKARLENPFESNQLFTVSYQLYSKVEIEYCTKTSIRDDCTVNSKILLGIGSGIHNIAQQAGLSVSEKKAARNLNREADTKKER